MTSHRRVKDIAYDDEELYSDEEEAAYNEGEQGYTAEDKQNFADLTPVVQAHLSESSLQVSDRQVEEALWHYYWDVAKSVDYLKKQHAPKEPTRSQKQAKPKSKFDQAAEKNAASHNLALPLMALPPGPAWFDSIPWTNVSHDLAGDLVAVNLKRPAPKLLGGSSKLAKLAEGRRKAAEAAKAEMRDRTNEVTVNATLSSLDRLALSKSEDKPGDAQPVMQARKYPMRKKTEPAPPPPAPTEPEPEVAPKEALPDLRAAPSRFGLILSSHPGSDTSSTKMSLQDIFGTSGFHDAFKDPSPDDIVLSAHGQSKRQSNATNNTPSGKASEHSKAINGAPSGKASGHSKTANGTPSSKAPPQPHGQLPNARKLWEKSRTSQRPFAAFVVAGHVDHGKSTLMGRLLLDTGAVQQRDIDKFRKQAAEIGKESFALAWVMDTGTEERERGVTVDIAQHNFSTAKADFTILDAPGHRDFIPSMISGASMADIVVLVIDANQLESGIKGQTGEHIRLAYGVGIRKVVVAINKMDASNPPWDQRLFEDVKDQISRLLRKVGFTEANMLFVPCSGLNGENVAKAAPQNSKAAQVKGGSSCLVAALETFTHDDASHYAKSDSSPSTLQETAVSKPLRMQVADVYRGGIQNPLSVSGRIISGDVVEGQTVIILPSGDQATVKGIERASESTEWAVALQIVALHLDGDIETLNRNLRTGDLICSTSQPAKLIKTVIAKVQVVETILPQAVELHLGRLHIAASIKRLIETVDVKGDRIKKSPRSLKSDQTARIDICLDTAAPLESDNRIILRSDGTTVAFGVVEAVIS